MKQDPRNYLSRNTLVKMGIAAEKALEQANRERDAYKHVLATMLSTLRYDCVELTKAELASVLKSDGTLTLSDLPDGGLRVEWKPGTE
jgi:hypothetical protein